jgi:hypothetical protein
MNDIAHYFSIPWRRRLFNSPSSATASLGARHLTFVTEILMIYSFRKREGGQNRESFGVVSTPQSMPMRNLLPGFRPLARH